MDPDGGLTAADFGQRQDCGQYEHYVTIDSLPTDGEVIIAVGQRCLISGLNCWGAGIPNRLPGRGRIEIVPGGQGLSPGDPRSPMTLDVDEELTRAIQQESVTKDLTAYLSSTQSWLVQATTLRGVTRPAGSAFANSACDIARRPLTEARVRALAVELLSDARAPGWAACVEEAALVQTDVLSSVRPRAYEEFVPNYIRLLQDGSTRDRLPTLLAFGINYSSSKYCGRVYGAFADRFALDDSTLQYHMPDPDLNPGRAPAPLKMFLANGLRCDEVRADPMRREFFEVELCHSTKYTSTSLGDFREMYGASADVTSAESAATPFPWGQSSQRISGVAWGWCEAYRTV
jgi:hypothetical protein